MTPTPALSDAIKQNFILAMVYQIRDHKTRWTPETLLEAMLKTIPDGLELVSKAELKALRAKAQAAA